MDTWDYVLFGGSAVYRSIRWRRAALLLTLGPKFWLLVISNASVMANIFLPCHEVKKAGKRSGRSGTSQAPKTSRSNHFDLVATWFLLSYLIKNQIHTTKPAVERGSGDRWGWAVTRRIKWNMPELHTAQPLDYSTSTVLYLSQVTSCYQPRYVTNEHPLLR